MLPSEYYERMRYLAHEKRAEYSLSTRNICLSRLREIYRHEGIKIDPAPRRLRKLKAAYFNDEDGCSVLLNMNLPEEPRLFAMVHELKHHYEDSDKLHYFCQEVTSASPVVEIGAEVFAAEFIFPTTEFGQYLRSLDIGAGSPITAEQIVRLKYHSPVPVSYQFLQKRLEWLRLIKHDQFRGVQFQKLYERIYGSRYYRRPLVSTQNS